MKVKLTRIDAAEKKVYYDVFKDDGTTPILSGESADYSEAVPDVSAAAFTDFAAVVVSDATAKKDALVAKLSDQKTQYDNAIAAFTSDKAELESKITDLGTAVAAIA